MPRPIIIIYIPSTVREDLLQKISDNDKNALQLSINEINSAPPRRLEVRVFGRLGQQEQLKFLLNEMKA